MLYDFELRSPILPVKSNVMIPQTLDPPLISLVYENLVTCIKSYY